MGLLDFIIKPVTGIVSDVLKRVLPPEKMSDGERAQIEQAVTLKLMEMDMSQFEKEIEDRANARALAAKESEKGTPFTMALAAINRPIWSIGCFAIFAWTIIAQSFGGPTITLTEVHKDIMMTVIFFYFGGRTLEKTSAIIKGRTNGA